MGVESVALALAGLAVGQSLGSAFGLGCFVAGWACGAWLAGRSRIDLRRGFLTLALVAPAVAWLASRCLFALGAEGGARTGSTAAALGLVALVAVPQGAFLPWFARARGSASIASLFASNLVGALLGAWAIGYVAVGAWGREGALHASYAASACAALLGAWSASGARDEVFAALKTPLRAGWIVGCATLWTVGLEWLCVRLGVLWIGSQQSALVAVIACSLLALALGAALVPLVVPRDERGVLIVLALAGLASTWPLWAAPALERARATSDIAAMLVLCVPTLLPLGAVVPTLHRALTGESGAKLGGLLLHEAWGALAAGPLVHWWLVPSFGVGGAIGALCACAAAAAIPGFAAKRTLAASTCAVALGIGLIAGRATEPALASPKLVDPALTVRAFVEDREFAVTVVDDGLIGERTLLTDQFRAAGTGRDYRYMRALGHLPVLLHPAPKQVAVVALGTGTTLGAVSQHREVEVIDVLEISPAVVSMAPHFEAVNHGALGDPRVHVRIGDARHTLALEDAKYDVITMEPLLPDSPFGVYLYTSEFYAVAKHALAPGGLMCQWVPPHALEPEVFDAVLDAFARAFPWSGAWLFGTQVVLIGADAPREIDATHVGQLTHDEVALTCKDFGFDQTAGLELDDLRGTLELVDFQRVAELSSWARTARALSDRDPWIAYRDKPTGGAALEWLPTNLERLRGKGNGSDFDAYVRARIEFARTEIDLRAGRIDNAEARERPTRPLQRVGSHGPRWPASSELYSEIEFLYQLRRGVGALQSNQPDHALDALVRAADLRPERGDVHVYLATARSRLGLDDGARAEFAKARELCPRILETPAGQRALQLGLRP